MEQFADRVARLSAGLRANGVRPGDRVGMLSLNSDRYIEYLTAVPWLGAALNAVNIRWSLAEIGYSLRESGTRVLLVDDTFKAAAAPLRAACACLETVIYCGAGPAPQDMIGYEDLLASHEPIDDTRTGGDSLLGVFYTGGTTGNPKGVMLSHNNVLASAMGSLSTGNFLTRGGRLLHSAPMFHMADFSAVLAGNLSGSTHVIVPSFSPQGVLDAIVAHDVQDMLLVPTMIQMLVDHPGAAQLDLSGIRSITYGASVISEAVLQRATRVFPNARFTQAYGMTEVSPVATLLLPDDHDDPALLRSAGRAAPHCEVRIVDPDDNEVPRGEIGEVIVKGDNVMLGYWELPEESAAAIRDGWMHTGDAVGWMTAGMCTSSIASRTWWSPAARTSTPPRWRTHWPNTRRWPPAPSSASPTSNGANGFMPSSSSRRNQNAATATCKSTVASTLPTTRCHAASSSSMSSRCPVPARSSSACCVRNTGRAATPGCPSRPARQ